MKKCLIISFFNSHNIGDRIIALSLANRYQKHFNVVKCSFEGTLNIWPEDKYNYGIKDDLKIIYGSCFTKLHKVFLKKKNKFQLFFNESYDCLAEIFLFNRFLQI